MTRQRPKIEVDGEGRAQCPDCGEFCIDTQVNAITGNVVRKNARCEDCQQRQEAAERLSEEERARFRAKRIRENLAENLQLAGVPRRYLVCSRENFQGRLPEDPPAFITGPPGVGKTHVAVAYLRETVLVKGVESVRFVRTVDLLKTIRDTFSDKSGASELQLLEFYGGRLGFLVLDDLGAEKVSDYTLQTLYDLLDRRYGEMLGTAITSNLSLSRLAEHYGAYGDRLASRIAGMGMTLEIKGRDRRWEG